MSHFPFIRNSRTIDLALLLVAIAVAGVALVCARPSLEPKDEAKVMPTTSPTIQATAGSPLEVELIDLRPSGFEPHEINRPAGRFLLNVNNRSGMTPLSLSIQRENQSVAERKRLGKDLVWRKSIDLSPGHYVLREANHPGWQCLITITR